MSGHRITWFGERPVEGTVHHRPRLLDVFPCERCGWMRPPFGFGCTCLGLVDVAQVDGRHQAAVKRATQPEPEAVVVAPVDPAGRGWAAA